MKLKIYQIDAFTDKLFGGNPAAVIPLKKWLPDKLMQQLAMENNLAETVFFVPVRGNSSPKKGNRINRRLGAKFGEVAGADYDIRWFTPVLEINLCGHATLASAFVLFKILKEKKKSVSFSSKSGLLFVKNNHPFLKLPGRLYLSCTNNKCFVRWCFGLQTKCSHPHHQYFLQAQHYQSRCLRIRCRLNLLWWLNMVQFRFGYVPNMWWLPLVIHYKLNW